MSFKALYVSFDGRISRSTFWLKLWLPLFIVGLLADLIDWSVNARGVTVAAWSLSLIAVWPWLAGLAKRWHDRDKSAWWILIILVPFVGPIWTFVECGCMRGTKGANRFGRDPLSKSFAGGVHPPEKKDLTCDKAIQAGPAVKEVAVMLGQHIGAVCRPLVGKGDAIEAGQKIGDCEAFVSAPVHSPVAGKVKEIALRSHAVLGRSMAIVIEASPENPTLRSCSELKDDFDTNSYSAEQICQAVREAGIVGMGGAGFPTRVKIEPNPRLPKGILIVDGCECEPYITCDYRVMLEWTGQIIAGIKLARKASGCSRVLVGIEDNKPQAIEVMKAALRASGDQDNIKVVPVRTKYPQGGERQLIKAILKKNVPTGGIPPMIGVVVLNVATVAAIAEAVVCNVPLTHRVVTVTGEAIAKPGNYYVPIGMTVEDLLEFCGSVMRKSAKVVLGGPMMGIAIADLKTPVTKTTNAITVLTKEQIGRAKFARSQTPCIRCGRCLQVCPENLNPTKIAHAVKHNLLDLAEGYYMSACIECGCCSYVCPANIELTGYIKTGKIFLARQEKRVPG